MNSINMNRIATDLMYMLRMSKDSMTLEYAADSMMQHLPTFEVAHQEYVIKAFPELVMYFEFKVEIEKEENALYGQYHQALAAYACAANAEFQLEALKHRPVIL
jgi:hypothetical protein